MRISDWSSDVCSSDLTPSQPPPAFAGGGPDQELAAEAAITDQRGGAASDDSSNPCGAACSPDPCSYQSPSTIRKRKGGEEGKGVSVRVDLGGRRNIKKNQTHT